MHYQKPLLKNRSARPGRLAVVDALRGFALVGVGMVHFLERFVAGPLPEHLQHINGGGPLNFAVHGLLWASFGKFFALFSLLFGVSYALAGRGHRPSRRGRRKFFVRSCLLLLIGVAHQAFYRGDILIVYALLSPLLLFTDRLSGRWLLAFSAVLLLGLPRMLAVMLSDGGALFGIEVMDANAVNNTAYLGYIRQGAWWEMAKVNLSYGLWHKAEIYLGMLGRAYYVVAYFLLGVWLVRVDFFRKVLYGGLDVRKYVRGGGRLLCLALAIMLVLFALGGWPVDWQSTLAALALNAYDWTNAIVAGLLLLGFCYAFNRYDWLRRLASLGRMGLSNYLLQTLVGTALFYGWGAGLFVAFTSSQLLLVAILVIGLQIIFSHYWLRRYQHGPVEHMWRVATDWCLDKWPEPKASHGQGQRPILRALRLKLGSWI